MKSNRWIIGLAALGVVSLATSTFGQTNGVPSGAPPAPLLTNQLVMQVTYGTITYAVGPNGTLTPIGTNSEVAVASATSTNKDVLQDVEQVGIDGYDALKGLNLTNGLEVAPFYMYHAGDSGGGLYIGTGTSNGVNMGFSCAVIDESTTSASGAVTKKWNFYDGDLSLSYTKTVQVPVINMSLDIKVGTGVAANLDNPNTVYSQSDTIFEHTWSINANWKVKGYGGIGYLSKWTTPFYIIGAGVNYQSSVPGIQYHRLMKAHFPQTTLDVRTGNGLDDLLMEPMYFHRADGTVLRAPKGGTTDGLSSPRCVQNIIPPTGCDWFSAVLHDSGYRDQLEYLTRGAEWKKAHFTQKQCDDMILEAMSVQGVGFVMRHIIYYALRMFGNFAFKDDRAAAQNSHPK